MTEEMNVQVNVYEVGDIVRGKVVKLEDKQVLVEVENSKQSGIIPISELSNLHIEKPSDAVAVGDEVTAKVKKVEEGQEGEEGLLILSKKRSTPSGRGRSWKANSPAAKRLKRSSRTSSKAGLSPMWACAASFRRRSLSPTMLKTFRTTREKRWPSKSWSWTARKIASFCRTGRS